MEKERQRRHRRLREWVRERRTLNVTWRVAVLTTGSLILLAGLAMLLLPGPGWASIFLGLAILATEFAWAQRLLGWTKRQARLAAERALDPRVRRRNQILVTVGLITIFVVVWWYFLRYGLPDPIANLIGKV